MVLKNCIENMITMPFFKAYQKLTYVEYKDGINQLDLAFEVRDCQTSELVGKGVISSRGYIHLEDVDRIFGEVNQTIQYN